MNAETWVTQLTSPQPGAIAVVEVHGPNAREWVLELWSPNRQTSEPQIDEIRYGTVRTLESVAKDVGESVVLVRKDSDRYEIHCHGGRAAPKALCQAFLQRGARLRSIRDWMRGQSTGPFACDALEDLLKATTLRTTAILMDQWRGALDQEWAEVSSLKAVDPRGCAWRDRVQTLLNRYETGKHLIHPWQVLLCGPPNVGKSSLLNRLLGYARAIVHSEAGTTRDLLSETTSIEGWPIHLVDSAGIRGSSHAVESEGIDRAVRAMRTSDRILLLVGADQGWTSEHEEIWKDHQHKTLVLETKTDLPVEQRAPRHFPNGCQPLQVSAATGEGMNPLMVALSHALVPDPPQPGTAVPFRLAHADAWRSLLP